MSVQWRETYEGGSPENERWGFEKLARDVMRLQLNAKTRSKAAAIGRAFHAKSILGVEHAHLHFADDLPEDLRFGFAQPGGSHAVTLRFSNAHGTAQADTVPDARGLAMRVHVSDAEQHDWLLVNRPASPARNAAQLVALAEAQACTGLGRWLALARLAAAFGAEETRRMLRAAEDNRAVTSLALETYWSQGAIRWGEQLAVRYLLRPAEGTPPVAEPPPVGAEFLRRELTLRLKNGDVAFDLYLQRFVDEATTPIENTSVAWSEAKAPPVRVARLTIARQDVGTAATGLAERRIDDMAFNPWNTTEEFRPLGNLNRACRAIYDADAAHRLGYRWYAEIPLRNRIFAGILKGGFRLVNHFVEWHQLPLGPSLLNLDAMRYTLRAKSLIDTEPRGGAPTARPVSRPFAEAVRTTRTHDGSCNDLSDPKMGAVGATFGRNMQPIYRPDLFNEPSAFLVSEQLLHRETFIPAKSLNILAAAWIQFQVHDWVNHARYALGKKDVIVPLPDGMTWQNHKNSPPEAQMRIGGDRPKFENGGSPILFENQVSHWWDGSEVYGSSEHDANLLREEINGVRGAKLRLPGGYLPADLSGMAVTGFNQSWWLGLSAMHTLFAREHNLLCDLLRAEYRDWTDERIYQTARLIVSALIAKIHTVEWTPTVLGTKTIEYALNANWNGPPQGLFTRLALWLVDSHAMKAITKTVPDHHAAPYSLTEDFTTVYRMHPLIPDEYQLMCHASGRLIGTKGFLDVQGPCADPVLRETKLTNVLYSVGIAHPGAITLHNFPKALRKLERDDGEIVDLAVVDIVRTRRRGVPRYNDFRAGLHKPRISRWEDMCADPESVRRMKEVYRGDIDMVDTVVGLLAETPPENFGFSDTAFRIFLLMATRRLQSDRFLTVDFRPEVYSPFGMDWLAKNNMTSLLLRHCPELANVIPRSGSAFVPWRIVAH